MALVAPRACRRRISMRRIVQVVPQRVGRRIRVGFASYATHPAVAPGAYRGRPWSVGHVRGLGKPVLV